MEDKMKTDEAIKREAALQILYDWTVRLCECAGEDVDAAKIFWGELTAVPELLSEYAYYYDNQEFLCSYQVDGYTIADIVVWQMDHFRAHMDRGDSVNRYNKDRLILMAFRTMIEMSRNPDKIKDQFSAETGTDLSSGWTLY